MLLTRNSGRKDTAFLLIDKYFYSFSLIYHYLTELNISFMSIFLDSETG